MFQLSLVVYSEAYMVFDATSNLKNASITATDQLGAGEIPKTVADWILTCQGSSEVHVKKTTEGGKIDAWVYYDSDQRMAWNMSTTGTTLQFTLIDHAPEIVNGSTLIHY